jgi:hypothetical protein
MAPSDKRIPNVLIEDARILFRNFAGAEDQYNRAGDRGFSVVLPPNIAKAMTEDGWNVKYLKPREEGEEPTPYVSVAVSYKNRPPLIVTIANRKRGPVRTTIPEDMLDMLDYVEIVKADLILNPYVWHVRENTGVKAYLKSLFITVAIDELEEKYSDIPEIDFRGRPLEIGSGQSPQQIESEDILEGEVVDEE